MKTAERMENIPFSGIRKVFEEIIRREKKGDEIIRLEIGRPDFDTPLHIKEKAKWALDKGLVHYTSNYGLLEFRKAISEKLWKDNGLEYDPENEIIVTIGANEAVFISMMALLNPGDEVLIPSPCWEHYYQCARLCGAVPVPVPLKKENRFQPKVEDFEQYLTSKSRMITINTPNNPTGAVFTKSSLEKLSDFVQTNDLFVLSDEIYEKLIYAGNRHISFASLSKMRERTVTINGMSKIYAMTGWRLGYAAAPKLFIDAMIRVHQYTTVCATTFVQLGGLAALNGTNDNAERMVREFDRRRKLVYERLNTMPGIELVEPGGAFYVLPYIGNLGMDSNTFAKYLLEKAKVAVVPGDAFGEFAQGTIRLSYANSYENLEKAMDRIEDAIRSI